MKKLTWAEISYLERLQLGIKHIHSGEHISKNFHDHIYSELAIVLRSDGAVHWAEGKSFTLSRGDVILIHPGKLHGYENAGSLEIFNLLFEPEKLPLPSLDGGSMRLFNTVMMPKSDRDRSPEKPLLHLAEAELLEFIEAASKLQKELQSNAIGRHLRCLAIFIDILILICRAGGAATSRRENFASMNEAVHYLNLHFRERPDINFLAHNANMSRRVFFRRFHGMTGMSPLQYMLRKSLAAAEELLTGTDLSLSEIAYECGFCDSNHFNKLFKNMYGMPPGEFRKKRQQPSLQSFK